MHSPPTSNTVSDEPAPWVQKMGLVLGPSLFIATLVFSPPEGLAPNAWLVCGLALWMACWWITEAVPLPVTSLLPVLVLPMMNVMPLKQATQGFSADIIFLFLGGFMLSIAMEKWRLHLRIGLGLLGIMGKDAKTILASLMLATGFMGMWISNTATTIMMMPMALSVALLVSKHLSAQSGEDARERFTKAIVLGIAYSPCLGGLSTFIGTPTNAVLEGFLSKTYDYTISLADWMSFGVPLSITLLVIAWIILRMTFLSRLQFEGDITGMLRKQYSDLGPMQTGERLTLMVFLTCLFLWKFGFLVENITGLALNDAAIAIFGALLLFTLPLDKKFSACVLSWKDTEKLPWGILIFFGGSLSISAALTETGVTDWMSAKLHVMHGVELVLVVALVIIALILVSEMMSNVATITAFLPILAALATGLEVNPLVVLIPATLAASCAFMMPGASAPNAIAYSTGYLKVPEMIRTGLWLNLFCAIIILIAAFTIIPELMGFDMNVLPEWAQPKDAGTGMSGATAD